MYRALVQVGDDGQVALSEEEVHHLVRVRRLQPGQMFWGLDGTGQEFRCRLEQDHAGSSQAERPIPSSTSAPSGPSARVPF